MTVSFSLLPLAAAATRYVVDQVSDTLKTGLSFASALNPADANSPADPSPGNEQNAVEGSPPLTNESQGVRWRAAWQNLQFQTQELRNVLVEQFAAQGIDLSEPIVLTAQADGSILAVQGHLDRSRIELLFESNPALTARVQELF
ncbi:MAG: hypothetical protein ACYC6N_28790, partial [Pirellulaceae bacterium]